LFRPRELAFKQFKCPRPQCVNISKGLRQIAWLGGWRLYEFQLRTFKLQEGCAYFAAVRVGQTLKEISHSLSKLC